MALTGGEPNRRVLLSDLRGKVGLTREDFDTAMLDLQSKGRVVLMRLDNAAEITKAAEAAAIKPFGGDPRHLAYFRA